MNPPRPEPWSLRLLTLPRLLIGASILLFLASLTQTALYTAQAPNGWGNGFPLLLVGWIAIFEGVFAWFANPMLAVAWLLMVFRPTRLAALICAALALALALSFLKQPDILINEAGTRTAITGYGPGYWLWVASMITVMIGAIVGLRTNSN